MHCILNIAPYILHITNILVVSNFNIINTNKWLLLNLKTKRIKINSNRFLSYRMSFFGSKLFGLSSNGAASTQSTSSSSISGAETIERLCERVQQSLLVEDRKDSLNAIKSLSKKYKLEVGTQAMPILIDILKQNRLVIYLYQNTTLKDV